MAKHKQIELIGYACGIGAGIHETSQGPNALKTSAFLKDLQDSLHWQATLTPKSGLEGLEALDNIAELTTELAQITATLVAEQKFFLTIGGDHTSAIGTWSGVAAATTPLSLGLLWIDAHMDSHTDKTTPSGNIHGMPLAALLGQGNKALTHILMTTPKLLPANVCIVGARSFEPEEQKLLESLKVRIFYMDEVNERGLDAVLKEAHHIISDNTAFYGISLDLDAIDPDEAPGVGTPEKNGIHKTALLEGLDQFVNDVKMIGAEIVEFNPTRDIDQRTEKLIVELLEKFVKARG